MSEFYDRQGNPLADLHECGRLHENIGYKRVAKDTIGDYWVSTVWLGLNHQYDDGPILIFETMIFPTDSYSEEFCERYTTEEQAIEGHQRAIELAKSWVSPAPVDTKEE